MESAGLPRRLASGAYELLLLIALLFVAAFIYLVVFGSAVETPQRYYFQCYLLLVSGTYFVWFWIHGGQTLAMKTWRLRLVAVDGNTLSRKQALFRFTLAVIGLFFFGVTWWWALLDREHALLHDRLAGTRLVLI